MAGFVQADYSSLRRRAMNDLEALAQAAKTHAPPESGKVPRPTRKSWKAFVSGAVVGAAAVVGTWLALTMFEGRPRADVTRDQRMQAHIDLLHDYTDRFNKLAGVM